MSNPIDLVKNYMNGTKAIPLPPNSQQEGEQYNEKQIEGQTEAQTKLAIEINKDLEERYERKRRYDAEKELYESNQQELDDLDDDLEQSEPDYNDNDTHLQDDEFTGNYFAQPDEDEPKETLGNKIRAKYDSFKASASDTAESLASSFGAAAGVASAKASAEYSRFKRGDPIFAVRPPPAKRGKNPSRYISRPGRNISKPYTNGRFGDDSFTLSTNGGNNLYYPVNETRKSSSLDEPRDLYLPSGTNPYEGEFSGRNAFKQSEFSDERERYDPFGFGGLSGDGFNNTSGFGSSLMGFGNDGIFGGMSAGRTDTVFGDGAMFNAPRGKAKKEPSGFGLDLIIGDSGGMYNTIDTSPRKTTKRKSTTRKTAKKATKKPATKRKPTTRKQTYKFALP